mgnify:CR=1 FL=1
MDNIKESGSMKRVKISTLAASPNGVGKPLADSIAKVTAGTDDRRRAIGEDDQELEYVHQPIEALLGVEWSLNMLGGGGNPSAWYKVNGETGGFDQRKIVDSTDHVGMGNDYIGVELESRPTPPAAAAPAFAASAACTAAAPTRIPLKAASTRAGRCTHAGEKATSLLAANFALSAALRIARNMPVSWKVRKGPWK